MGYVLRAAAPDLGRGVSPRHSTASSSSLDVEYLFSSSCQLLLLNLDVGYLLSTAHHSCAQHSETKIMASSHHFMANGWGNIGNSGLLYFGGVPKSLQMVIAVMELKDAYSLEGKV